MNFSFLAKQLGTPASSWCAGCQHHHCSACPRYAGPQANTATQAYNPGDAVGALRAAGGAHPLPKGPGATAAASKAPRGTRLCASRLQLLVCPASGVTSHCHCCSTGTHGLHGLLPKAQPCMLLKVMTSQWICKARKSRFQLPS